MQIQHKPSGFSSKNSPLQMKPSGVFNVPFPLRRPATNCPSYLVPLCHLQRPFPSGRPSKKSPQNLSPLIKLSFPQPSFLKLTKLPLYYWPSTMQTAYPYPLPYFHQPLQLSPYLLVQTPTPCLLPSFHYPMQYYPLSHQNYPSPLRFSLKKSPLYTPEVFISTPLSFKLLRKTPSNTLFSSISMPNPYFESPTISPKNSCLLEYSTQKCSLCNSLYMLISLLKGQYYWMNYGSSSWEGIVGISVLIFFWIINDLLCAYSDSCFAYSVSNLQNQGCIPKKVLQTSQDRFQSCQCFIRERYLLI